MSCWRCATRHRTPNARRPPHAAPPASPL
jgi:hypothetical protein